MLDIKNTDSDTEIIVPKGSGIAIYHDEHGRMVILVKYPERSSVTANDDKE